MTIAGWAEILFVGLLAFIIIGPKDLPKVLFTFGKIFQAIRRLSNEFLAEFEKIHYLREKEIESIKQKNERVEK